MAVRNKASGIARMKATKSPTVILETEGHIYLAEVERPSYHTFRGITPSGELLRGVYFSDTKRNYTFLNRHENIEDVLSTTEHENLHAAIDQCREWEWDDLNVGKMLEKDMIYMDDFEEHNMIRIALQEEEYFGE